MDFYFEFEQKYRGSRELIKRRLSAYLPFVQKCRSLYADCKALDLGCGRGEWLELMQENGIDAAGVDLDDAMVSYCNGKGFSCQKKDALAALKEAADESLCIVSGFHIAEHVPFGILMQLVHEAKRVLKPAGLLILETPNPENPAVGSCNFYNDPSHIRPLTPALLSFLPEYEGFHRTKILRLQEDKRLHEPENVSLFHVLTGTSPDYSIVAQKEAAPELTAGFDSLFQADYGITLEELSQSYDTKLHQLIERQAQGIERLSSALREQSSRIAGLSDLISAQNRELNELRGIIMNTRHRTLFGAVEWLLKKIKRSMRLRLE